MRHLCTLLRRESRYESRRELPASGGTSASAATVCRRRPLAGPSRLVGKTGSARVAPLPGWHLRRGVNPHEPLKSTKKWANALWRWPANVSGGPAGVRTLDLGIKKPFQGDDTSSILVGGTSVWRERSRASPRGPLFSAPWGFSASPQTIRPHQQDSLFGHLSWHAVRCY